jgi:hypothetical protein
MPSGTKRILEEWLKSPIEYQGELEVYAIALWLNNWCPFRY